jgi:hypothetical protein
MGFWASLGDQRRHLLGRVDVRLWLQARMHPQHGLGAIALLPRVGADAQGHGRIKPRGIEGQALDSRRAMSG